MKTIKINIAQVIVTIIFTVIFISCGRKQDSKSYTITNDLSELFPVEFNPIPPTDLSVDASDSLLVKFAWEEFLALNWRASYNSDALRDNPDPYWKWNTDASPYPDLVVWETYAHRTELRPYDDIMEPFDNPPHYSFGAPLTPASPNSSFLLFNNLDENSEIGSCNLYAYENIYGRDDTKNLVLYQAKVNRDEYNYIAKNFPTNAQLKSAAENNLINLPAGGDFETGIEIYQGAMEIKTAWRLLVKEDDPSQFFIRNAIFYEKTSEGILYHNDRFALIGIHIIHKTKNHPDFVFATWEHVGVEDDNMAYVLIKNGVQTGDVKANYKRLHPIPDLVKRANASVHEQIKRMNPNSIWKNYRLIGVQGTPTNDQNSMSYFLANYVIESDSALANFYGSSIEKPHDGGKNTELNGVYYNMGGCMGCHGATQLKGTDFSFLLDQKGKPVWKPDFIDSIPNVNAKLELYLNDQAK